MTVAVNPAQVDPVQDRWRDAVRKDGRAAVVSLLDSTARLGRLAAAEPEDAAATLLLGADDTTLAAFDCGCLDALLAFRATILSLTGTAFQAALGRLVALVSIVRRLAPHGTVVDLHRHYIAWNGFFENFVIDRGLDLRREFWRILALTQDEAATAGLEPRRLMPLWLAICGESGGSGQYDASCLRVALLGLRRLPLGEAFSSNEDFALHGLARWAASRNPLKKDFLREWHVLEGDYPHGPGFWPPRVEATVAAMEQELFERTQKTGAPRKTFPAAAWWREDVEIVTRSRSPHELSRSVQPPPRERLEELLRRIGEPFAKAKPALDVLIGGHRRYADATGDVFYLVRTACNVGMRLIEKAPAGEREVRGEAAVRLAALAFAYSPTDAFAWSLLLRALTAAGRPADAEQVGWEAMRRFPENPQWRNQLATVLVDDFGRAEEAAALLRESTAQFPDDEHSRTQLATVLAEHLRRPEDAAEILRGAMMILPSKPTPRTQLATVLADDLGLTDEALAVLQAAQRDGAANDVTALLLGKLQRGLKLRGHRQSRKRSEPASATLDLPTAAARRALFRFEHGLADLADVRGFLDRHSPDAYLAYVGDRTGARPAPATTTFALAFDGAARKGSAEALRILIGRARSLDRILISQAIGALESRIEGFQLDEADAGGAARVRTLVDRFAAANAPTPDQRLLLLRDTAGSFLSTDVLRLAA
ncbi:MAG: hypothetical protein HXX10_05905 [Rhodoplanes sp.]|uniref:hypothetical protein n=1 Tax=Rhodoplanes sp. TaxID=1968906 RepID=UPI0018198D13|nr:hypothetical protein [Rhodoplanes sp.]NVO13555.1 hypothetical protein [Rhodoplanes sp.]